MPTRPPARQLAWAAVALGLAAPRSADACCSINLQGTSSRTHKRNILSMEIYQHSTVLLPEGYQASLTDLPELSDKQRHKLQRRVATLTDGLADVHATHVEQLSARMGRPLQADIGVKLVVSDDGAPVASASARRIQVDRRVLQGLFRGALIDGTGASWDMDDRSTQDDDLSRLEAFLEWRGRVNDTKGRLLIADVFGGLDSPWFTLQDEALEYQIANQQFAGVLIFLVAHELGHVALGHHELSPAEADQAGPQVELDADRYAAYFSAMVLSDLIRQEQSPMGGFMLGMAGLSSDSLQGYDTFFDHAYERIGFSEDGEQFRFVHPEPSLRRRTAELAFDEIRAEIVQQAEQDWDKAWEALWEEAATQTQEGDPP